MPSTSQTKQLQIRQATVHDAETIALIQIASFKAACGTTLPASFRSVSLADSIAAFARRLAENNSFVWLVERDDEALGFVWMGESRDMDEEPNATAEIFDIHVIPSAVGKGLGSLLLKQALAQATRMHFSECTAWVTMQNHYAKMFYRDRAFVDDLGSVTCPLDSEPLAKMRFRLRIA
ncbi:MAG TPA: GNAT family N-acetyltransferase [Planktothrix sp.]|jgi:GNAT superfamily N-acetyltransferase